MNATEIEQIHERALDLYVEGRYREARHAWQEILSIEPDDSRAQEGARMVEILVEGRAEDQAAGSVGAADHPIEETILSGDAREAAEAARQLAQNHPDDERAQSLMVQTRERLEAEAFIEAELSRAMKDLQMEDPEDARRACGNVLALEPQNSRAHQLLDLAEDMCSQSGALHASDARAHAEGTLAAGEQDSDGGGLADDFLTARTPDEDAATPRGDAPAEEIEPARMVRTAESVSGGLFEMADEDIQAIPTGSTAEAGASFQGSHEPVFDLQDEEPIAFGDLLTGSAEADEARKEKSSAFSEIEAEIDESHEAPSAEGDLSFDDHQDGPPSGAPRPQREATLSPDLSFEGVVEDDSPADEPAWRGWAEPATDSRITALLQESRTFLESGRYSEAIEAAARAFAIDEEAPGARQIIDEARRLQDQADRSAEETLDMARQLIETGDDQAAVPALERVLAIHPGHREVLEMLDGISRRRTEKEIGGRSVATSMHDSSHEDNRISRIPTSATTDASYALAKTPSIEPEPEVESMVPRSRTGESTARATAPAALPATKDVVAAPKRRRGGRLILIVSLCGGIALAAIIGLRVAKGMLEPEEPTDLRTADPTHARKQVVHVDKMPAPPAVPPGTARAAPQTVSDARRLLGEESLDEARDILFSIIRRDPTNAEAVALLESTQNRIHRRDERERAMESIASAFKQDRYEDALRMLYRLPAEVQGHDIELIKANAWYNNGIQYLLGGNCTEAIRCFDESLGINPRDEGTRRLKDYAKTYLGREKDTAYLIYVENIPKRPLPSR